jgi:cell division protein ZapA (FtsZ GTPase activity inhibitor)
MSEHISVQVLIAERTYPIKIDTKDAPIVREAARLLQEKLVQVQQMYAVKDKQDYLAMSALLNLVDILKEKNKRDDQFSTLEKQLSEVESQIQVLLK